MRGVHSPAAQLLKPSLLRALRLPLSWKGDGHSHPCSGFVVTDVLLGVWGPVNYGGYWRPRSKNLVLPVQCSHRCRFAPKYGCHWRECAVCLHINQGIKISKEAFWLFHSTSDSLIKM
ncbi:uncharacterized protein [Zea mays]|nr:uncharacterized protein LOC118473137 isoform X2 [Zea mays]